MAKGFDLLIEFLLDEIALQGELGISVQDYQGLVEKYYSTETSPSVTVSDAALVDRRLLQKVWKWLTAHPDVWVGVGKKGNKLPFDEILAIASTTGPASADAGSGPNQLQTSHAASAPNGTKNECKDADSRGFRIYTTLGRMWQAVAGHGVDPKRIPDAQFQCLRIIAAAGEKGITQPDLVRISQQDKRSVPKRTDTLQSNGYIKKTEIQAAGFRTSLLIHKRYLKKEPAATKPVFMEGGLVLDNVLDCLCEWLRDGQVLTMRELEERFDIQERTWEQTALWKAYERLDIIGIIQRFKKVESIVPTPEQGRRLPRQLRLKCVRLLKIPTIEDRQRYHSITLEDRNLFRKRLEAQDSGTVQEHAENNDEDGYAPSRPPAEDLTKTAASKGQQKPAHLREELIRWNPDIPHSNNMYNLIAETGEAGISTMDLRARSYGNSYARPMDAMLGRFSDDWQSAQPAHLRHLAIIRDTAVDKRSTYYVYRTHEGFQKAVDKGDTQWELVRSRDKNVVPPPPILDEWGFPPISQNEVMKDGLATLGEVLAAAQLPPDVISPSDPYILRKVDGTVGVAWSKQMAKTLAKKRKAAVLDEDIVSNSPKRKKIATDPASRTQYLAKYRREKRLKEEADQRTIQIRTQSEGIAYSEVLAKYRAGAKTPNSKWLSVNHKIIQPIFKPGMDLPKFVIVDAVVDELVEPFEPNRSGVEQQPADLQQNCEIQVMPKRRGRPPKKKAVATTGKHLEKTTDSTHLAQADPPKPTLVVPESRVSALVTDLSDNSRSGVHINPPGSKVEVQLKRGQKSRPQLMVVIKFPWLQTLDWYVSALYQPPSPSGTPTGQTVDPKDDNSEPVTAPSRARRRVLKPVVMESATNLPSPGRKDRSEIVTSNSPKNMKRVPSTAALVSPPKRSKVIQDKPKTSVSNSGLPEQSDEEEIELRSQAETGVRDDKLNEEATNADGDEGMQDVELPAEDSDEGYDERADALSQNDWGIRSSNYRKPEPKNKRNASRKKRGTALGAGAVRFKRTQIILEILEKCHGAFPGDGEITAVFNRMQKQDGPSRTDRDTIIRAVKSLVDSGKLKKVSYAFTDKTGITVTRNLLLQPSMDLSSPYAQLVMKSVQDSHPKPFHPIEVAESARPKQTKQISRFLHEEDDSLGGERAAEAYRNYQKQKEAKEAGRKSKNRDRQREWYYKHKYAPSVLNVVPDYVKEVVKTAAPSQRLISLKTRTREQRDAREAEDQFEREERLNPGRQVLDMHTWEDVGDWTTYHQPELPQAPVGDGDDPDCEQTMAEILANMGAFVPVPEGPPTPGGVLPSIETEGSRRFRRGRGQADSEADDFWIVEDPASPNDGRLNLQRRGSVYSADEHSQMEEQHERRMRSDSLDNALKSVQTTFEQANDRPYSMRPRHGPYYTNDTPRKHPRLADGVQSAVHRHPFMSGEQPNLDGRRKPASKALLGHDQTTFAKAGIYGSSYEWKQIPSFLSPDQRFSPCTGTFSTEYLAWRRVRVPQPVETPLAIPLDPNLFNTRKRDIEGSLRLDDRDYNYQPERPGNTDVDHVGNPNDTGLEYDEIQGAWHEKQEMQHVLKDLPNFAVGGRHEGFVNDSLGHEQTIAVQEENRYVHNPGDRITLYGTSAQYGLAERPAQPAPSQTPAQPGSKPSANASRPRLARAMKQDPNCVITPEQARRLLFAVIAVKTLAGGIEQILRWPYVAKIFATHPNYDVVTFKARWSRMEKGNKEIIARLTRDFQDMFLMAYQRDEVPVYDVKDPDQYDWNAVVNWAMRNIVVFPGDIILPASRETLDRSFEVDIRPRKFNENTKEKLDHYLATNTRREMDTHRLEFFVPLALRPALKQSQQAAELSLARSWTRACNATEDSRFDAKAADAKLRVLDDKVVAEAVRQLHDEKVISHSFKGRHNPGRNYHLHDGYNMHFNTRALKLKHFAQAMAFKQQLDEAFATTSPPCLKIRYDGSDGQYMVITELLANGRIRTPPQLPPINSTVGDPWPRLSVWGFMEGHYRGRDTDKNVFKWDIDIVPTASYVSGFAVQDKVKTTPPPLGVPSLGDGNRVLIPIWRDIHGNLLTEHWRKLVYCVVQHIAFKAGSSIVTLLWPFKGLIWDWEMELLVGWLVEVGVARWTDEFAGEGRGIMAKEWWWTVVPEGEEVTCGDGDAVNDDTLG